MKLRFDVYSLGLSFFAQTPLWVGNSKLLVLLESIYLKLKQSLPQAIFKESKYKREDNKYLNLVWDVEKCADFVDIHVLLTVLAENEIKRVEIWNNPIKYHNQIPIERNVLIHL